MANKYELRRRAAKDAQTRKETPYASPGTPCNRRERAAPPPGVDGRRAPRGVVVAICCLLALATVAVFAQTVRHEFLNCDDNEYVYENPHVQTGLNPASMAWAIFKPYSANWHPLTWMSHMLDWQLFGTWSPELGRYVDSWPGGHHLVNVVLHVLSVVLLFLVLNRMAGATWPSAMVVALFAIHPLRVESVAWVCERKDMLSGLFFILTLAAYHNYASKPFSALRYAAVVALFAVGLTTKSMLVTLPCLLLLLDYWPLRRLNDASSLGQLVLEKVPLFGLSIGSCFATTWAQAQVGAYKPLALPYRIGNALVSYVAYLGQMFWPAGMVVHYPHMGRRLPQELAVGAAAILLAITALVARQYRRRYLTVGWLWYLGTLVPVIGLVQVGAQARADRYTYLSQIGLYVMLAWGAAEMLKSLRQRSLVYAVASAAVLCLLTVVAWRQTTFWINSLKMWEHSVACLPETHDFAHNMYGVALFNAERIDEAEVHYEKAIEINPDYLTPRSNLAGILQKKGKYDEALEQCNAALEVDPDNAEARLVKAVVLYSQNKVEESIAEFRELIARKPEHVLAHSNLAEVFRLKGRRDEALEECRTALALKPELPEGHRTMGSILAADGDLDAAGEHFRFALRMKPGDVIAQEGLADVLRRQGKLRELTELRLQQVAMQPANQIFALKVARALATDPRPDARNGAAALEIARRLDEAVKGQNVEVLDVLAAAQAETGEFPGAEATIRRAMATPAAQQGNAGAVLAARLQLYQARQPLRGPVVEK